MMRAKRSPLKSTGDVDNCPKNVENLAKKAENFDRKSSPAKKMSTHRALPILVKNEDKVSRFIKTLP
jgi:hypothetical protein